MNNWNRNVLLHAMVKHETLTINDIMKKENLGIEPDKSQVSNTIKELHKDGAIEQLNDVEPATFTITVKGITEYAGLGNAEKEQLPQYQLKLR